MQKYIIFLLLLLGRLFSSEYQFEGVHYLANYCDCNIEALSDVENLEEVIVKAATDAGANVLGKNAHIFPPCGLTLVLLLSESHASIHTYPEHKSCFVDFFTCGSNCSFQIFDRILRDYLKPKLVVDQIFLRNERIEGL